MKKINLILAVVGAIAVPLLSTAQNQPLSGKLTGAVAGSQKNIEAASVSLLKAKDSALVKMALTDKSGNYEIDKISKGKYLLLVQSVGFLKYFSEKFDINNNAQKMNINLKPANKDLGEVTVTTKKPLIEQKIDRTIVNVEASVTNVGATALEVLEKSPGIMVDKDGKISLKGKQGVTVLIDGKPSYLSEDDLANLLRNMNASQLDQIEIMTNPPAKYDASGNSGVINIKTKKTKVKGFNGSITTGYGQGVYPKNNESINLNFRENKWNLFGNYNFNYRENYQELNIKRNMVDPTTKLLSSIFKQSSIMDNINRSNNLKIGADFYASKKTTLGFQASGFSNNWTMTSGTPTYIYDKNDVLNSITKSHSDANNQWKNLTTNFNFRHQFDTTGQELTADLDYIKYDAPSFQRLASSYYDANNNPNKTSDTLDGHLPSLINIYSAKTDYTLP
jgi:hypothetical protein